MVRLTESEVWGNDGQLNINEVVQGNIASFAALENITDWTRVKKVSTAYIRYDGLFAINLAFSTTS